MLRPGVPLEKLGLACIVDTTLGWKVRGSGLLWGAVLYRKEKERERERERENSIVSIMHTI